MRTICNHIVFVIILLFCSNALAEEKYLFADKVEYNKNEDYAEATGNVRIIFKNYTLKSDRILYDIKNNEVYSLGNVTAYDMKDHIAMGDAALIKNNAKEAIISSFILYFKDADAIIAARMAKRLSKDHASMSKASFTSCPTCKKRKPLWSISARKVDIFLDKKKAIYQNMFFEIYGIPVMYFPYFSHPLPGAPPKSGVLVPNIKNKRIGIPIYLRPKSNLDMTITPRLSKKSASYELQIRHLTKKGSYKISGNVLSRKQSVPITSAGKLKHFRKIRRYNVKGYGNFKNNSVNYGFNLERVSDKDFLREYEHRRDPFLTTNLYAFKVDKGNYIQVNNTVLQGLGNYDSGSTDPYITPEIDFRYVMPFENSNASVKISNNTSIYHTTSLGHITKSFTELSFHNSAISKIGQVMGIELYNRFDLYKTNLNQNANIGNNYKHHFVRSIPEARFFTSYPLIGTLIGKSFIIEPLATLTVGRNRKYITNKIKYVDSPNYEFNDINFLRHNRHNGHDFYENGTRTTYGARGALDLGNNAKFGGFLGQMQRLSSKVQSRPDLVGRGYLNLREKFEIYYRFRKNSKNYASIFDEIGTWYNIDRLKLDSSIINLRNKKVTGKNLIRQFYFDTSYQLNDNWILGYNSRFDISQKKPKQLSQGIRVTYRGDCVSISSYITHDYTKDLSRGIGKKKDFSLKIGLRTINM